MAWRICSAFLPKTGQPPRCATAQRLLLSFAAEEWYLPRSTYHSPSRACSLPAGVPLLNSPSSTAGASGRSMTLRRATSSGDAVAPGPFAPTRKVPDLAKRASARPEPPASRRERPECALGEPQPAARRHGTTRKLGCLNPGHSDPVRTRPVAAEITTAPSIWAEAIHGPRASTLVDRRQSVAPAAWLAKRYSQGTPAPWCPLHRLRVVRTATIVTHLGTTAQTHVLAVSGWRDNGR